MNATVQIDPVRLTEALNGLRWDGEHYALAVSVSELHPDPGWQDGFRWAFWKEERARRSLRLWRGQMRVEEGLAYHVAPCDQGQVVERAYAVDSDGERYVRRITDRSDGSVEYEVLYFVDADGDFEPWNGQVPRGTWEVL